MNILITGGAGFIGSNLCEYMVKKGYNVYVLDNLSTGKIDNLSRLIESSKIKFYNGDIRDKKLVDNVMANIESIIHLAAIVSVPYSLDNPVETNDVNVGGTITLIKSALKHRVKSFIYISSCAVYGDPLYTPIDENHPTNPISPYAVSKLSGEEYVKLYTRLYNLRSVILRLFNVYGPKQSINPYSGVIVKFIQRLKDGKPPIIYGDGEQTRDFIYVLDVANAIELSLDYKGSSDVFNIGFGKEVTINKLANILMDIFNFKSKPIYEPKRPGDIIRSVADISKATKYLGFQPKTGLRDGLLNTLSYYVND